MVASDTVVGLVGAGVLLVALVGVFVYESSAVEGGSAEPMVVSASATASGTVDFTPGTGTRPDPTRPDVCIPATGQTACTNPKTGYTFTVKGLPEARGLSYIGYVPDGTGYIQVGKGSCTAEDCKFNKAPADGDKQNAQKFIVSLEPDAPPAPTYAIAEFPIANKALSGTATVNFLGTTGKHALSFNSLGATSEVSVVLKDVPKKAFVYHGWLLKENGTKTDYVYLGAFAPDNPNATAFSATLKKEVPGGKDAYLGFVVTFETDGKSKTTPGGPNVIEALYGVKSGATVAK